MTDWISWDDSGTIHADLSHAVVAIENEDGTPMPDTVEGTYGELEFLVHRLSKDMTR